jgi:hypothetical protein
MKLRAIPPIVAGMILATYASTSCLADIHVLKCSFDDDEWMYFTRYTDGTPARIGKAIGVGDKALAFQDRFGALVFIETNADGTPITFTTIERTLKAIHSSHLLQVDGTLLAPSQVSGQCEPVAVR